jgi:hypothetical protein
VLTKYLVRCGVLPAMIGTLTEHWDTAVPPRDASLLGQLRRRLGRPPWMCSVSRHTWSTGAMTGADLLNGPSAGGRSAPAVSRAVPARGRVRRDAGDECPAVAGVAKSVGDRVAFWGPKGLSVPYGLTPVTVYNWERGQPMPTAIPLRCWRGSSGTAWMRLTSRGRLCQKAPPR